MAGSGGKGREGRPGENGLGRHNCYTQVVFKYEDRKYI